MLIVNLRVDGWVRVALPVPPGHGYFGRQQDTERWRSALAEAGFEVVEQGAQPGTSYFLGQRPGAHAQTR